MVDEAPILKTEDTVEIDTSKIDDTIKEAAEAESTTTAEQKKVHENA